ncbi:hypothetical protein T265_04116 [Opisthorchis viverrini]|uniref:Uncharacterized protein n=1 Tax=Opisthorchis viverrini TaxID=6198 RepID=A0A075A114_OPIVI|nr:hypothetical protein T265_04116 [Opisthorchis viverrini]KER29180.1 hypothetical protein T265_04116 [Opisthorchis viverrini]
MVVDRRVHKQLASESQSCYGIKCISRMEKSFPPSTNQSSKEEAGEDGRKPHGSLVGSSGATATDTVAPCWQRHEVP